VSGWAWDQARPELRLQVQIWHGDRLLGTTVADRERADLKRNGIGDGRHAFQFKLDPSAEGLDASALVAKVVGPDLADPVPLFRPSETQIVVERTVLLPFARLQQTLDLIAERQLKLARACDSLRDEKQNAPSEIKTSLDRILAHQERLEERLKEIEVFQARFDSALRALSEQRAAGADSAEAPLKRAVRLLAGASLVSCCAIVLLLLRPILG
jgi:DNA repair exonuclease SbcCD ATPase subunit